MTCHKIRILSKNPKSVEPHHTPNQHTQRLHFCICYFHLYVLLHGTAQPISFLYRMSATMFDLTLQLFCKQKGLGVCGCFCAQSIYRHRGKDLVLWSLAMTCYRVTLPGSACLLMLLYQAPFKRWISRWRLELLDRIWFWTPDML